MSYFSKVDFPKNVVYMLQRTVILISSSPYRSWSLIHNGTLKTIIWSIMWKISSHFNVKIVEFGLIFHCSCSRNAQVYFSFKGTIVNETFQFIYQMLIELRSLVPLKDLLECKGIKICFTMRLFQTPCLHILETSDWSKNIQNWNLIMNTLIYIYIYSCMIWNRKFRLQYCTSVLLSPF